jgi:hypothetical protein
MKTVAVEWLRVWLDRVIDAKHAKNPEDRERYCRMAATAQMSYLVYLSLSRVTEPEKWSIER